MIANSYYHVKVFRSCSGLKPQNLFGLADSFMVPEGLQRQNVGARKPTDMEVKVSVTVSYCCCSKLLQVQRLQTSQILLFSNSGCQESRKVLAGLYPFFGDPRGKPVPASSGLLAATDIHCGLFLHLQNQQHNIFESLFKKIIYSLKKLKHIVDLQYYISYRCTTQ